MCDPFTIDQGPDWLWYAELAETRNRPWPPTVAMTRAAHAVLAGRRAAAERAAELEAERGPGWVCPRCGGPVQCPSLPATLAYRACGYSETSTGSWVHA
jgi:hypothetical protein